VSVPFDVAQALALARAGGVERLDAQRLLASLIHRPRSWLLAHGDNALDAGQASAFRAGLMRLVAGEPLAYLTGEQEFHGLLLRVSPQVLVPRPDTEVLADWAIERLSIGPAAPKVLDLGTGSGAIALALAHACPTAHVSAVDISSGALVVARANGERLGLAVEWIESNWWGALAKRRFDLIVSNPPYIADGDAHLAALHHEPLLALTAGGDGLDALRHIAASAAQHLSPGGWLLLEHGYDQAEAVSALLRSRGLHEVQTRHDLAGHPRCTGACLARASVGETPHIP
jgi:release factor glutamine methyltransferase